MQTGRKQEVLAAEADLMNPSLNNYSRVLSDFKLLWMLSFLLHHEFFRVLDSNFDAQNPLSKRGSLAD